MKLLIKAKKGDMKAGHKYQSRTYNAKTKRWDYTYSDTHANSAKAQNSAMRGGRFGWHDLTIHVDRPAGTVRTGKGWQHTLPYHYGEIDGTLGADGDPVDVILGPSFALAQSVYVVDQQNQDGAFDEHKVMIGFPSQEAAKSAYLASYAPGWNGLQGITRMSVPSFKQWLQDGGAQRPAGKPLITPMERQATLNDKVDAHREEMRPALTLPAPSPDPIAARDHTTTLAMLAGTGDDLPIWDLHAQPKPYPSDAHVGSTVIACGRLTGAKATFTVTSNDPLTLQLVSITSGWAQTPIKTPSAMANGEYKPDIATSKLDWYTADEYDELYPPAPAGLPYDTALNQLDFSDSTLAGGEPHAHEATKARAYLGRFFREIHGDHAEVKIDPRALVQVAKGMAVLDQVLGGAMPYQTTDLYIGDILGSGHVRAAYKPIKGMGILTLNKDFNTTLWHEIIHAIDHMAGGLKPDELASDDPAHPLHHVGAMALRCASQQGYAETLDADEKTYWATPHEALARFGAEWVAYRLKLKGYPHPLNDPAGVAGPSWTEAEMRRVAPYFEATLERLGVMVKSRSVGLLIKGGKQARKGGEVGVNGHSYKGGQFLPERPDSDQPQKERRKPTGRVEVLPYIWDTPPDPSVSPVYLRIQHFVKVARSGHVTLWDGDQAEKVRNEFNMPLPTLQRAIAAVNAGHRWIPRTMELEPWLDSLAIPAQTAMDLTAPPVASLPPYAPTNPALKWVVNRMQGEQFSGRLPEKMVADIQRYATQHQATMGDSSFQWDEQGYTITMNHTRINPAQQSVVLTIRPSLQKSLRTPSGQYTRHGSKGHLAAHRATYHAAKASGDLAGTPKDYAHHMSTGWANEKTRSREVLLKELRHCEADLHGADAAEQARLTKRCETIKKRLVSLGWTEPLE